MEQCEHIWEYIEAKRCRKCGEIKDMSVSFGFIESGQFVMVELEIDPFIKEHRTLRIELPKGLYPRWVTADILSGNETITQEAFVELLRARVDQE